MKATAIVHAHNGYYEEVELDVRDVYKEDEIWFKKNKVSIRMEDLTSRFVVSANINRYAHEIMTFSYPNESCHSTLHRLRLMCEKFIS